MNDDCMPRENSLQKLLEVANENHDDFGFLISKILWKDLMRKWLEDNFSDWKKNVYYTKEKRFGVLLLFHGHYHIYAVLHSFKDWLSL